MAIPAHVLGYGATASTDVFKVKFSYPLSSKVRYECYDNLDNNFPVTDDVTSTGNDIFSLNATFATSMIALIDTTGGAPSSTTWFPANDGSNVATFNRMKGVTYYVTQHGATVVANGSITFNMQIEVPNEAETSSSMAYDVSVRYTFTSTTPALTWYFNDLEASTWTQMTPDTHGIVHVRSGTPTGGPYYANIPVSGSERTQEGLVVASL